MDNWKLIEKYYRYLVEKNIKVWGVDIKSYIMGVFKTALKSALDNPEKFKQNLMDEMKEEV